ncbi:MAG: RNA methyltransferase [Bacillota bacterium]|nr:RNA methyltransferase [Bacillota bacterium]
MTITSMDNQYVRRFAKLVKDRAFRESCREYILEGDKLLQEALSCGVKPEYVFYLEGSLDGSLTEALKKLSVPLLCADERVMGKITDVKTPQGIVFSCPMPELSVPGELKKGPYIILDTVSNPGNLGTIIRTADAFGISGVILTGSCADPFSPKTARSAMGSLFRVKLYKASYEELKTLFDRSGIPFYSAVLSEDAGLIGSLPLENAAVIIGNEAHGVSEELRKLSAGALIIPMKGETESLNAAVSAAIFMWEMTKRG